MAVFLLALASVVACVVASGRHASAADSPKADFVSYPELPSITQHSVEVGGRTLHYEAEAGTLTLVNAKREPTARLFYVAYRLRANAETDGASRTDPRPAAEGDPAPPTGLEVSRSPYPDPATRPITFAFNGGPGSSSVWLHLGAFGPRRVEYRDAMGSAVTAPYRLVDNEATLLGLTDLVFIDPVSTGYSRTEGETSEKQFHGVESDIDSVAEFVRRYLTRERRWSSPKFIAGESYGTTRAAGLSDALWQRHGIALEGVVLISAVLDFATLRSGGGNDLPFVLILPSYTAVAHSHQALSPALQAQPLEATLAEAEAFARGAYATALLAGDALPPATRLAVRDELARLTGLTPEFIDRHNLRVSQSEFCKELLRSRSQIVGRLDGRFTGFDREDTGESPEFDPSYAAIRGSYTAALNDYVRRELGFESDLPYEIIAGVQPWDYGSAAQNRYLSTADRLRRAMHEQPSMRVFVAEGLTDLATPYLAAEHSLDHLGLAEPLRANIERHRFGAGHMMYIDEVDRGRLREALGAFYERTLGSK